MALEDLLTASVVRPVHIGWLDFRNDPLYGWTGPGAFAPTGTGDTDLDNNVFLGVEGLVAVTDFSEDQGMGGEISITFAIGQDIAGWVMGESEVGLDYLGSPAGAGFDQIVLDRRAFLGRKAVVWLGFLSADESAVQPEIQRVFSGVMVGASTHRQTGQAATITVTCDQDTQKARGIPVRLIDHQVFYPTDTATSFINSLARGAVGTGILGEGPAQNRHRDARGPRRGVMRYL